MVVIPIGINVNALNFSIPTNLLFIALRFSINRKESNRELHPCYNLSYKLTSIRIIPSYLLQLEWPLKDSLGINTFLQFSLSQINFSVFYIEIDVMLYVLLSCI